MAQDLLQVVGVKKVQIFTELQKLRPLCTHTCPTIPIIFCGLYAPTTYLHVLDQFLLPCHFLYCVGDKYSHSRTRLATVSYLSPHSLRKGEVLSLLIFWSLILFWCSDGLFLHSHNNTLPSVALFRSPFFNQPQVFSSLNSVFLKNNLYCECSHFWSSLFCFLVWFLLFF